jgi:hypothetical protein
MKRTLAASLLTLTIAFAPGAAVAKGCIHGALIGGVTGYWSGHGTLTGAAVGCMTAHAANKMRERAARQRTQEQARRERPIGVEAAAANRATYMYAPQHRNTGHKHKIMPKSEDRVPTGD